MSKPLRAPVYCLALVDVHIHIEGEQCNPKTVERACEGFSARGSTEVVGAHHCTLSRVCLSVERPMLPPLKLCKSRAERCMFMCTCAGNTMDNSLHGQC